MQDLIAWWSKAPLVLEIVSTVMAVLALYFFIWFLCRGAFFLLRLCSIRKQLRAIAKDTPPDDYRKLFERDRTLAHLWDEYKETLHEQKEEHGGLMQTLAWRATVPAEAYFSTQYMVDNRLGSEFFKHLPGIFTGLGIIGTFSGLINGLKDFKPSPDPAQTVAMVGPLINAVHEAFLVSAVAIGLAMLVTLLEKLLIASLYKRTEEICLGIDQNFEMGAGEEYLSRLVNASESSASQSKMLKDALVNELGNILHEVSKNQIEALQTSNRDLGGAIAESIKTSLSEPLSRIEDTFKNATDAQSESTVKMLGDVMASFSQKLNDLFGGQISSINDLNRQSADTMKEAVASLNTLIGDLGASGKQATDQMAAKMADAIQAMELRQADINARTEQAVKTVSDQMAGLMTSLADSHANALAANREREAEMVSRTSSMVEGLSGSVEQVIKELAGATQTMVGSVDRLSTATTTSIDKMNLGAEKIATASSHFTDAGNRVADVMNKAADVGGKLTELSGQLVSTSAALQETVRDYQNQRTALVSLLDNAKSAIELARKEASITEDVLQRIEGSAAKLSSVQFEFEKYLDGISDVLVKSSDSFQQAITSTLRNVNTDFHEHMEKAVRLLSAQISELGDTFGAN